MKNHSDDREQILDEGISVIRDDTLDDRSAAKAADRVWKRIAAGSPASEQTLHGCSDFQDLIPGFVNGSVTGPRALLVEDHTRDCVACRRLLMEERGALSDRSTHHLRSAPNRFPRLLGMAAAAMIAIGLAVAGIWSAANSIAERGLSASLESVDGQLLLVSDDGSRALASDDQIRARQTLRTTRDSDAVLRLADGSIIEIDARSQLELRGSVRGTRIRLVRGNIIVRAAQQRGRRLYVATDDCLVAVKGTVFAVDHGLKGSRVSVIEGKVEVRQGGGRHVLNPGQQLTTSERLRAVAISEQIAWSRDADGHRALLHELSLLHQEMAQAVDPPVTRTSTTLLDLAPADTLIYAALPNLAEGLGDARRVLDERLASSDTLRQWWLQNVVANGLDRQIDQIFDRLQTLGEVVADEVVITVGPAAIEGNGGPLVLALLDDSSTFSELLADEVDRVNTAARRPIMSLVEDPLAATEPASEIALWVSDDLFAATTDPEQLRDLALRMSAPSSTAFVDSEFHARLVESYRRGIAWLIGVDMEAILNRSAAQGSESQRAILEGLGVLDASTLIVERHRVDDTSAVSADLIFDGPRRGMAAWLADPAPMGSLEFLSPDASFAAAVVAKDAVIVFDELLQAVTSADSGALEELDRFEDVIGINLRSDLAATLGGEGVVALDGPLLPTPAWKIVAELYDPETLQAAIERAIAEINHLMEQLDREKLILEEHRSGGRSFWEIRGSEAQAAVVYTMADGYLVIAPDIALVHQALQYRESGVNLPSSTIFRELLPDNGYTDCSALLYRNLGPLAESLPDAALGELPPDAVTALGQPMLFCVYGEEDRIILSGIGDGLLGAGHAIGLSSALKSFHPAMTGPGPVSSQG